MSEKKKNKTIAEKISDKDTIRIEFTIKPEDGFLYTELSNVNNPTLFAKEAYKMHINNVLTGRALSLHYSNTNAVNMMMNQYMPMMMPQVQMQTQEMLNLNNHDMHDVNLTDNIEEINEDSGVLESEEINFDDMVDDDDF